MRIIIQNPTENALYLMRRAGYTFQRRAGEEMSFVRPLARAGFPRFHAYVKSRATDILVNFHLDQKRETYGSGTRHHGEYEDEGPLSEEAQRILPYFGSNAEILQ